MRRAVPGDLAGLAALWREAFGDEEAEIRRFFDELFPFCQGFCADEGGTIASMLFALPCELAGGGEPEKAAYLYAVATDKRFRGRGLARRLMAFAEKELQKEGVSCVLLVPGEPSLVEFYRPLGYAGRTFLTEKTVPAPAAQGHAEPVSPEEYGRLREELLRGAPHVKVPLEQLRFEAETRPFYALRLGGRQGCAAASAEDGTLVCDELLPDETMLPALLTALPAGACRIRAPGRSTPFAMFKRLQGRGEAPYLAFAFD
jgi:GNAT superfamily N-acetyltransferase